MEGSLHHEATRVQTWYIGSHTVKRWTMSSSLLLQIGKISLGRRLLKKLLHWFDKENFGAVNSPHPPVPAICWVHLVQWQSTIFDRLKIHPYFYKKFFFEALYKWSSYATECVYLIWKKTWPTGADLGWPITHWKDYFWISMNQKPLNWFPRHKKLNLYTIKTGNQIKIKHNNIKSNCKMSCGLVPPWIHVPTSSPKWTKLNLSSVQLRGAKDPTRYQTGQNKKYFGTLYNSDNLYMLNNNPVF